MDFKQIWKGNFIKVKGVRLHYIDKGEGETLLLVHGLGAYSYTWRYNIDPLSRHYRVIALDLKGFGFSEKPIGPGYSIDHHVDLVNQFLIEMGLKQVDYIGSSMGGEIALRLCLKQPSRIRRLVLIGSSGYRDKLAKHLRFLGFLPYTFLVKQFVRRKFLKYETLSKIVKEAYYQPHFISKEEIDNYLYPVYSKGFEESYMTMLREFDFGKMKVQYSHISHPALILAGEKDQVIPYDHSLRLSKDLRNSQLITIKETGHFLHEEKPGQINELILKFLTE